MGIKAETVIAQRCYDFLIKKYGKISEVCRKTKVRRPTLNVWRDGNAVPSAYFLQHLTELGADPKYLLTGKFFTDIKTEEEKESRDALIDDFAKTLKKELLGVIVRRDIHDDERTDLDSDDVWEKIDEVAERMKSKESLERLAKAYSTKTEFVDELLEKLEQLKKPRSTIMTSEYEQSVTMEEIKMVLQEMKG